MKYYIDTETKGDFSEVVARVRDKLAGEGFGVLTEIDVQATMKKKLDIEYPPYLILGACNPPFAHRALRAEDKIGTMLPCNVIVRDKGQGRVEVAAVDPVLSMQAVENDELTTIAQEIRAKLQRVVQSLPSSGG